MSRLAALALVAGALVGGGCAETSQATVAASSSSASGAQLVAQANEPRSTDASASQAPSAPAKFGSSVGLAAPTTGAAPSAPEPSPPRPKPPEPADGSTPAAAPSAIGPTQPPKTIGARHVLIQWMGSDRAGKSVLRTREQAQALAQEVLKRAKAGEDIARLAVEYSDEPNAGTRGGSLGRFGKGMMVGAFEQVAFKLKIGEISDIVETPFGFHIIQRTE